MGDYRINHCIFLENGSQNALDAQVDSRIFVADFKFPTSGS